MLISPRWRKTILITLACLLGIVAFAVWRWRDSHFDWARFFATLTSVNWYWLTLSILLILLTYVGRALRWDVMLRPLRPHPNFWNLCSATVIGFTAIVILGRPGELVRPYLISIKERVPFSSQMAAWFLERVLDTLMVLLIFGFALTRTPAQGLSPGSPLQWALKVGGYVMAVVCIICVVFLFLFRNFSEAFKSRILSALTSLPERHYQRIETAMTAFATGMQATRNRGFLTMLLVYTVLEWILIVAAYVCLFRAFPATAGFLLVDVLVFVGFVALGSIIQIPGIGGGVQVAAVVVLTELFGLPIESATGLALLIWVLTFVSIVPFGLLFAFHEGINWRNFRNLAQEAPPS